MRDDPAPRRRLLGRVLGALLLAAALALALLLVVVPLFLGATPYAVLTGSMRPDMPPGSLVVVRPAEPEEIRVGDAITYQIASGRPEVVTHRVVGVGVTSEGRTFTAQGDANALPDPDPVVPGQVRGVVVYAVPWAGYVSSAIGAEERRTALYLVAGGVVLYGLWQVAGGVRERRRARRRPARHAATPPSARAESEAPAPDRVR
ncbi:signal peptidase I [Oerskovia flava]|uniref:signal peptidase I n=1 Tax=Oerskovia flava TaxID=2986422 RepID=UPI00223F9093|nr:signal peptidase I [Oerskovia sp. JB1-3-2]